MPGLLLGGQRTIAPKSVRQIDCQPMGEPDTGSCAVLLLARMRSQASNNSPRKSVCQSSNVPLRIRTYTIRTQSSALRWQTVVLRSPARHHLHQSIVGQVLHYVSNFLEFQFSDFDCANTYTNNHNNYSVHSHFFWRDSYISGLLCCWQFLEAIPLLAFQNIYSTVAFDDFDLRLFFYYLFIYCCGGCCLFKALALCHNVLCSSYPLMVVVAIVFFLSTSANLLLILLHRPVAVIFLLSTAIKMQKKMNCIDPSSHCFCCKGTVASRMLLSSS